MNPDSNLPGSWDKLVAARRALLAAAPRTDDESAPFGFAQRIASRALFLQRHRQLSWWTRWSLRAAGASAVVAALVALARAPESGSGPLMVAPTLEIPGFSAL